MREAVISAVEATLGTMVETNAPLMSAGLDSLSVAELVNALSTQLDAELAPTDLFDHPTLDSIVSFLSARSPAVLADEQASFADERPVPQEPTSSGRCAGRRVVSVPSWCFELAWRLSATSELRVLTMRGFAANTHVPATRWTMPSGVASAATYGAFAGLDQLGLDRGAFGISVAEARSLDPQQRLVLCVGYGALHRSRVPACGSKLRDALTNDAVGVFVGVEASGLAAGAGELSVFSTSGGALSITSGRLSYTLGLVGPCYSIDTACASALAALHVCASAVGVGGECDEGVGMGTKVLSEGSNFATAAGGMTSPHGRCHTFDRRADGYCRGEGCGAFLVSSLAARDGWHRPSILASAMQQDGPSASLTAPNGSSQRRLIETVRRAIIPADDGGPVLEAHGTGTALGDPIEGTRVRLPERG